MVWCRRAAAKGRSTLDVMGVYRPEGDYEMSSRKQYHQSEHNGEAFVSTSRPHSTSSIELEV